MRLRLKIKNWIKILVLNAFGFFFSTLLVGQELPPRDVITTDQLVNFLKEDVKKSISKSKKISPDELALYFRQKFSERYFYDWETHDSRFDLYKSIYGNSSSHKSRAKDHMDKFADSTQWVLPFNYQNGNPVNAYALRHLARQHKMLDIAYRYFYDQKDPKYIQYFINQRNSLNTALKAGKYEKLKDGNGVYESFRSGYRVLNWLQIHNMFLGEEAYSDEDQLVTIATLLQHGAHLFEINSKFHSGNHQTRGVSALAMLSILLRDFKGTDQWFERAMTRLGEHLSKEINGDGFQFERSVHYHMSDIDNYFYVYQLAKISNLEIDPVWEEKLKSLFTTLIKIAYPDKSAPVLQDDTDNPWGEKNDISGSLTLGFVLFEDPNIGYFAEDEVEGKMYWYLKNNQLELLENISRKKPKYGSLEFPDTKYYVMREGWSKNDHVMIISAGLDLEKPDHQHGDMLGIQAMANGKVILPNYQVRYSLKDLELFKNSMVKNVALVDEELQGKEWTSNKGGSGFGKFRKLPEPKTILWKSMKDFDLFIGSHDGFEDFGVNYTRQIVNVSDDFWVVKDNFISDSPHTYKQIWQGHFTTEEGPGLLRSSFSNANGCDILQLNEVDEVISDGARGKQWNTVSRKNVNEFSFVTLIYPYRGYSRRINEDEDDPVIAGWKTNDLSYAAEGKKFHTLSKGEKSYLFGVNKITIQGIEISFSEDADIFVKADAEYVYVTSIGSEEVKVDISGSQENLIDKTTIGTSADFKPGNLLRCKLVD